MTGPVPASPRQLSSWLRSHRKQAGAGAAVAAVVLFALYRRHVDAGAGDTSNTVAAAAGSGTLAADNTAGLSGTPNTSDDDVENWLQDSLNAMQGQINGQLANPTAPAAPATPTAAQKLTSTLQALTFVRDPKSDAIYEVDPITGKQTHVSSAQWSAIKTNDPTFAKQLTTSPNPIIPAKPKPATAKKK